MFLVLKCIHWRTKIEKINNLSFLPRKLEKWQPFKLNSSRKKKIIHVRAEINATEDRRIILKIDKSNNGLFEKINEIDYLLASLTKIKRGQSRAINIRNKRRAITVEPMRLEGCERRSKRYAAGNYKYSSEELCLCVSFSL